MQRTLVFIGAAIVVIGLLWPVLSKLPLGRLPGDLVIDRPGVKVIVPLTSMLLVSALLSLLGWLVRR